MCTCTSCAYTDSFSGWIGNGENVKPDLEKGGFERWPRGNPTGARRSAAEYSAHVAHMWVDVQRNVTKFQPGQAPIYPSVPGLVHPVAYNTAAIRWNAQFGVKYVPEPEPVKVPTMIDMARQMREQARAERKAIKEWAKQLRAA